MRYPDGGGLTAQGRSRREQVRLQAAEMFAQDADARQIARSLRVSTKSVYQWRRAWRAGGEAALASKGPGGNPCKLDEDQLARLGAALDAGPAACGWDQDQRWTLARVAALIARLFGVSYTLRGRVVPAAPARASPRRSRRTGPRSGMRTRSRPGAARPGRRYEASGGDRSVDLLRGRVRAGAAAAEGPHLGPPRAHAGGPGLRPGIRRGSRSPGLACLKAGQPGRFFYRMHGHRLRPGTRRAMSEADYAAPDHRRAPLPERPGHRDLGQPQHAPQPEDARLHRRRTRTG